MKTTENYDKAYAEVIEVLNYIPLEDYKKIPKTYIKYMEENSDENSSFVYNIALPFEKQNISDAAKNILGMIFRLFIISQEKKDELNAKDKENKNNEEREKQIKYNPDNLFRNKNVQKCVNKKSNKYQTNSLIKIKEETFFTKLLNLVKKLFKKQ